MVFQEEMFSPSNMEKSIRVQFYGHGMFTAWQVLQALGSIMG